MCLQVEKDKDATRMISLKHFLQESKSLGAEQRVLLQGDLHRAGRGDAVRGFPLPAAIYNWHEGLHGDDNRLHWDDTGFHWDDKWRYIGRSNR